MALFPHMKANESAIWSRFLDRCPWPKPRIVYDLRLGEGVPVGADVPDWVRRMTWALSTKRVDALVETPTFFALVEVKERGGLSAVGQLLGYGFLFARQYRPVKKLRLVLVCERLAPDVDPVLKELGIETYVV